MKALTVRQPWASLIMFGGKDIENRRRPISCRGRIAVHVGKRVDLEDVAKGCRSPGVTVKPLLG
jgi:hypothetical protein